MNYQFSLERIHKDICESIHPPYPYGGHIFPMIEPQFIRLVVISILKIDTIISHELKYIS